MTNLTDKEKLYDFICQETMKYIIVRSKDQKAIAFTDFDWANDNHRFVFHNAVIVSESYCFKPIQLDCNGILRGYLSCRFHKHIVPIAATHDSATAISVPKLLEDVRKIVTATIDTDFAFSDIYYAYFKELR